MRPPIRSLGDEHVRLGHERLDPPRLTKLEVACVKHRPSVMLEVQLSRAEHVAGRVERHRSLAAAERLSVAKHPPAAWPSRLRDQGQGLRGEQRFLVPARVVGMGVRDEREAAHDQRVEP